MRFVFVLAIVAMIATPTLAANLLTNGDFEAAGGSMGAPGITPGWTNWSNGAGQRTQGVKGSDAYNGSSVPHSGALAWACYCKSSYSGGIYQEVTVVPGQTYVVDGWWKGIGDGGVPWTEVGVVNGAWNLAIVDGGITTTIWKRDNSNSSRLWPDPNTNPAAYIQLSTEPFLAGGLGTNVVTAASNKLTLWIKVGQADGTAKNRVRFDDMSVSPVPEPASILALVGGLAGLAGVIRRRR